METTTKTNKNSQKTISEAIKKIALGRSLERINMTPSGMGGVGTARMIHGYVSKIHDNPNDSEYEDYAGTIDVGEFPDETASSEPVIHKGVLLSGIKNNANGFLIVPTLYSDVTIILDSGTKHAYVINYSHADFLQFDSRKEAVLGASETEELDPEDNDSPDYDELEKTGNESKSTYTPFGMSTVVRDKDGNQTVFEMSPTKILQSIKDAEFYLEDGKIISNVGGTSISVQNGRITIGSENANQPLVLGQELARLMLDFLTECSKITTPTLMGTMPALNIPNFTALTTRIESFLSKTSYTE